MTISIDPSDLSPFATIDQPKAQAMIDDALAMARLAAPCIDDADFPYPDAAKAIVRGAILRWNESGAAGRTQITETVGPFGHSEAYQQATRRSLFWPSEVDQLRKLCSAKGRAFDVDLTPPGASVPHDEYWPWGYVPLSGGYL